MGKIGVVLAILAAGAAALMMLSMYWAKLGAAVTVPAADAMAPKTDDLQRLRERRAVGAHAEGTLAKVTPLRHPRVNAS